MQNQIAAYDVRVQFLAVGFNSDNPGHISCVGNPGVVKRHALAGFYAIGVGILFPWLTNVYEKFTGLPDIFILCLSFRLYDGTGEGEETI